IAARAVYAYKNPGAKSLDAVLGSTNVTEAVDRVEMLQKIFSHDRDVLDRLKVLRSDLEDEKRKRDAAEAAAEQAERQAETKLTALDLATRADAAAEAE